MRIGIDCFPIQDPASAERGIGRYSRDLLKALMDAASPDDEFMLYLVEGMDTAGVPRSECFWRYLPDVPRVNRYRSEAIRQVESNPDRLDALLILSPFQSHVVPDGYRIPRIASVFYDLIPEVMPNDYFGNPEYRTAYENYIDILREYDALLTMSEHAKQDLIRRRGFPKPMPPITAIGTDASPCFRPAKTDSERAEDQEILRSLGIFEGGYVLNVGHEDPRKGAAVLARAFAMLPEGIRSGTRLVFAYNASESHKEGIRTLANQSGMPRVVGDADLLHELGMSPQVHFTGWCEDRKLCALYRDAAVMVFPSLYEGFGLPILEAMRCGCPVVCGDNSSQPEVVGNTGFKVKADDPEAIRDAMGSVLGSENARKLMADLGRDRSLRFSWQSTAEKALAAIRG